jgi:hypothetical protein
MQKDWIVSNGENVCYARLQASELRKLKDPADLRGLSEKDDSDDRLEILDEVGEDVADSRAKQR